MHMADALLSPAVGGAMWTATAVATAYASTRVKKSLDDRKVPLMAVLAAFVFTAQMINFTIPGTGSSGHLGGGLLLAIILGPHAAFLAIASVLTVQALFFADGGLLALGCNIFNLGIFPCYIAYPLIYKKIIGSTPSAGRLLAASLTASVIGLQLGSLGVVLETAMSGVTELPIASFLIMMQPIHLAIGIVEGLATAGVLAFILKSRPEIIDRAGTGQPLGTLPIKKVLIGLTATTVVAGGLLSWFASSHPDGLEWSLRKVSGHKELAPPATGIHSSLEKIQEKTEFMPNYDFAKDENVASKTPAGASGTMHLGTSAAGLLGGLLVLLLGMGIGLGLKKRPGSGHLTH